MLITVLLLSRSAHARHLAETRDITPPLGAQGEETQSRGVGLLVGAYHFWRCWPYRFYKILFYVFIPACASALAEVVFIIDSSGSINEEGNNWDILLAFIMDVVRGLSISPDATRVGAVSFSTVGKVEFKLNQYSTQQGVVEAINRVTFAQDRTNLADGLQLAREEVFSEARVGVVKLALLITDGKPNEREPDTEVQATLLRNTGVILYAIGVTDDVDFQLLRRIASNPNEVVRVEEFSRLSSVLESVIQTVACPISKYDAWRKEGFRFRFRSHL